MHAVQAKHDIVIEERRGRQCIRFSIQHGDYNGLEENGVGKEKVLILTEHDFIQGVALTLEQWSSAYDTMPTPARLADAMAAMQLDVPTKGPHFFATIPIDSRSTVLHVHNGLNVWVELDTFIKEAMHNVRRRTTLAVSDYGSSFEQEFQEQWQACIQRLGGSSAPPPEPLPFDPDAINV